MPKFNKGLDPVIKRGKARHSRAEEIEEDLYSSISEMETAAYRGGRHLA